MAEEKPIEQAKLLAIEEEKLGYTKVALVIGVLALIIGALGFASSGIIISPISLAIILSFLFLILVSVLIFMSPAERAQSIDWGKALALLEDHRRMIEKFNRWGGKGKSHPIFEETYYSYLRRLYLHAILEGRKDFAEELWKKGQLSKNSSTT